MWDILTKEERKIFKRLNTPQKVQDFLDKIPANFEPGRETLYSPRMLLQKKRAHCIEAATFAAAVFKFHGRKPLLLDLRATKDDLDHVVALFKEPSGWGAISKVNHAVLMYRDPIYKNIRELAISYFHEYFLQSGKKTLREYSAPFDLNRYKPEKWITAEKDIWFIDEDLDKSKHFNLFSSKAHMRLAYEIQIKAGNIATWSRIHGKLKIR